MKILKMINKKQKRLTDLERKKMKRILVAMIMGLFLMNGVIASYVIFFNDSITANVSGGGDRLEVTESFTDFDVNTLNAPQTISDNLVLNNLDGDSNVTIDVNTTKVLLDFGCSNFDSDCVVDLDFEGNTLTDGETFVLPAGESTIVYEVSCVQYSCNQTIETEITIQE